MSSAQDIDIEILSLLTRSKQRKVVARPKDDSTTTPTLYVQCGKRRGVGARQRDTFHIIIFMNNINQAIICVINVAICVIIVAAVCVIIVAVSVTTSATDCHTSRVTVIASGRACAELQTLLFAIEVIGVSLTTAVPETLALRMRDVVVPLNDVVEAAAKLRRQRADVSW